MGGLLVGGALGSIPGIALAHDRCPEGQTRCGERCVNLKLNEHRGSCGNRCVDQEECVEEKFWEVKLQLCWGVTVEQS
jgi:hypothetical protein